MRLNLLHPSDTSSGYQPATKSDIESETVVPVLTDSALIEPLRPQFWSRFTLDELNHSEWEALCDGCGSCCLIKYIDEDGRKPGDPLTGGDKTKIKVVVFFIALKFTLSANWKRVSSLLYS